MCDIYYILVMKFYTIRFATFCYYFLNLIHEAYYIKTQKIYSEKIYFSVIQFILGITVDNLNNGKFEK